MLRHVVVMFFLSLLPLEVPGGGSLATAEKITVAEDIRKLELVVPEPIRLALQGAKYDQAVAAIEQALADKDAAEKDYLAYLKGRAFHLQQKYDEAIAAYEVVEKQFPQSNWVRRARFGKAVSLMRKGDFRGAEEIYKSAAEFLLSAERKHEIAAIYLEFAEKFYQPKEEGKQPDYQQALTFFNQALEVGPKPETREEVELAVARCYQQLGQLDEAARRYEQFARKYPKSEHVVEALFRQGESLLGLGKNAAARRVWQDLLSAHADSRSDRIPEAMYRVAATYGVPSPGTAEALNLGVGALNAFAAKYPEHKLASLALLQVGQSYMARHRSAEAVSAFQRFLADERYKDREEVPIARQMLGTAYLMQKKFTEAIAAWQDYLVKHPAHQGWSDVQRAVIDAEYAMGLEKRQAKEYEAARNLWTAFENKYPLEERNRNIGLEFGLMLWEQEKFPEAIAEWRRVVSKYPQTEEAGRAQFLIALTLEEKQFQFADALKAYRALNWSSLAGEAQQRIARLTNKSLAIATERVFRSNETPKVVVHTRNVDSVHVRAYTVDLETYFRKMHLARGVESLDTALIDPDTSFDFKVPEYVEHKAFRSEVEVPLPGAKPESPAGVVVVTVSSTNREATTLLIQSDLDLIVKSSRDEVFVFAQNMRTGKPWPGVKLLISNGTRVFAEAQTGKDGVFQAAYAELKEAADVRVFGIAGGHVASNVVNLQGAGVAQGLEDKGYIYTDRPAYRAGQIVHVRGVIRKVKDDQYLVDKGGKYTLEILDSRNRVLHHQIVELAEYGSFHARFVLPAAAVPGQYRVQVTGPDDKSYQGEFRVHEYQLEPVQLAIESDRFVYYRGEVITGKIKARFYYGAPLAGRQVIYQLAGGKQETAVTDANGEIAFKFPTRDFEEAQVLPLVVSLPERNLNAGRNFFLATQGFSLQLFTVRPVFLAGESFEVAVKAADAEGKPLAQKLTLSVAQVTNIRGQTGEIPIEKHEIETDKEGQAKKTLALQKGGEYVVRAEGIDRFGNAVTQQHVVNISDDSDAVRLRILADKHTFKVGDTAEVQVHWREKPALALVTYQGARVLGYQLVELRTGANKLTVPLGANLAPNFELAVAVMTDTRRAEMPKEAKPGEEEKPVVRFHTASSPFTVERDLRVKLIARRKNNAQGPMRPGEEIELVVTTTDPQGKPLAAEVSVAMIEQALLDRFGGNLPAIGVFFRGQDRETAVRTTSSVTFEYRPETRDIDRALLAERDRLELVAEETARLATTAGEAGGMGFGAAGVGSAAWPSPPPAGTPAPDADDSGYQLSASQSELSRRLTSRSSGRSQRFHQYGGRQETGPWPAAGGLPATRELGNDLPRVRQQLDHGVDAPSNGDWNFLVDSIASSVKPDSWQFGTHGAAPNMYFFSTDGAVAHAEARIKLRDYYRRGFTNGILLLNDGKQANLSLVGKKLEAEDGEKLAKELSALGAILLPAVGSQETGYWAPSVLTDNDGQAVLRITLPERSTSWKLQAKGITLQTLAGEAETELVTRKDLFGELKLPLALHSGDEAEVIATIHNPDKAKGAATVTFKATVGEKSFEETRTVQLQEQPLHELPFKTKFELPAAFTGQAEVTMELTIKEGAQTDLVRASLPLLPTGVPVYVTASGTASSDATTWVEAAKDAPLANRALQILVGPSVEKSLLEIVTGGRPPACQLDFQNLSSSLDNAVSDIMASLGVLKLLDTSREPGSLQAQALDARIRSALSLLVSQQQDDGSWSWTGHKGAGNYFATSRVVWALSLARQVGYRVPESAMDSALNFLASGVSATAEDNYETKAVLLHGLSVAGRGDFALANRLHRNRPALSDAALCYVALALIEMERQPMARELLDLLHARKQGVAGARSVPSLPPNRSSAELAALAALAWQRVAPNAPPAKEYVDWLMANRAGYRWRPEKATGPAALAVAEWFSKSKFEQEHYKLAVFVNDTRVTELEFDQEASTQTIDVPARLLGEGRQRVHFQLTGRGRFTYQVILSGQVAADQLKNTAQDFRVQRHYEPAPRELDGQFIPRGFDVLQGNYTSFRNPLTELPVGKQGHVELHVTRTNAASGLRDEQLPYLVVTEPLPSGVSVNERTISGGFERYEIRPGAITFYIGGNRYPSPIHFDIHGYVPGKYTAGPTVVRDAYHLDQMAFAAARPLDVPPLGAASRDEYKLTPRELYELGRRLYDKGQLVEAGKHLAELFTNWNLNPEVYRETARMLLDVHLQSGPPAQIVRYFEIIKEKWPDLEIPFDKIVKVASAYYEIGEYERSYLVFRATIESSFGAEAGVAGFLEAQGQFLRSVEVMDRLLREYPPEGYVAAATYYLAQRVYAKAPEAAEDQLLREKKINRVDLVRLALQKLDNFLTEYPDDPAADQAGFSVANALLELRSYKRAIAACERYVDRYPKSDYLDSYWYVIGFANFALGQHEQALAMCQKVADATRIDPKTGRGSESRNKFRAIYIMGQIFHSLGKPEDSIREYARVEDKFVDAKQAIEYFTRKAISLPEVTAYKPGEAVKVKLAFRNVANVDVKVYRIDLMKFSLLRRDLAAITNINLAGIRSFHEASLKLGEGKDYRDREQELTLPVKEEGAYLVVCRGENLHASGMVLITPLVVEVQEEAASGRVRATVKDATSDKYVHDVHVKVIGSRNGEFISGQTDLRGIYVADGVQGTATVIAQAQGNKYAFFRGKVELGPPPAEPNAPAAQTPAENKPLAKDQELLEDLQLDNERIQNEQKGNLKQLYEQKKKGVELKSAY